MLLGPAHFVIAVGARIERLAVHELHPEQRRWTALDPRQTHGARPTFG